MAGRSRHMSVEQPDNEVIIDYLSFCPTRRLRVEGVRVQLKLEFDSRTERALLHVDMIDDASSKILYGDVLDVTVSETDKVEADDDED